MAHWLDPIENIWRCNSFNLLDLAQTVTDDVNSFYEGANLNGVDVSGQNLIGLSFEGAKLEGIQMDPLTRSDCPFLSEHYYTEKGFVFPEFAPFLQILYGKGSISKSPFRVKDQALYIALQVAASSFQVKRENYVQILNDITEIRIDFLPEVNYSIREFDSIISYRNMPTRTYRISIDRETHDLPFSNKISPSILNRISVGMFGLIVDAIVESNGLNWE